LNTNTSKILKQNFRSADKEIQSTDSIIDVDKPNLPEKSVRIVGTPDYMSPEMISGEMLDNPIVDYWALGVILYEMLIGLLPFEGNSPEEVFENIRNNAVPWDEIPVGYSEDDVNMRLKIDIPRSSQSY